MIEEVMGFAITSVRRFDHSNSIGPRGPVLLLFQAELSKAKSQNPQENEAI